MKAVADTIGVARSNLVEQLRQLEEWAKLVEGRAAARALIQPAAELLARLWTALVNGLDLSLLRDAHDRAATLHLPGGHVAHGIEGLDRFLLSYLSALPDARLSVDHAIALEEPGGPPRLALRWRIVGTLRGDGAFGAPTGARVLVLAAARRDGGPGHPALLAADEQGRGASHDRGVERRTPLTPPAGMPEGEAIAASIGLQPAAVAYR